MSENYQKKLDSEIERLCGEKPKLLLHSCCGPCSSYVLEYLTKFFCVTLFWCNPNIWPESEFQMRLEAQKQLLGEMPLPGGVELLEESWEHEGFLARASGLENEPEGGARCTRCFEYRLEKTAQRARELGFDWFCTTLTVSPHKDAQRINAIGARLGEKYGVKFLPSDFKKREGYKRSIALSGEYGLYRQDYCGCEFSKRS